VAGVSLAGLTRGEAAAKLTESPPSVSVGQSQTTSTGTQQSAPHVVRSHLRLPNFMLIVGITSSLGRAEPDPADPGAARPDQRNVVELKELR